MTYIRYHDHSLPFSRKKMTGFYTVVLIPPPCAFYGRLGARNFRENLFTGRSFTSNSSFFFRKYFLARKLSFETF